MVNHKKLHVFITRVMISVHQRLKNPPYFFALRFAPLRETPPKIFIIRSAVKFRGNDVYAS